MTAPIQRNLPLSDARFRPTMGMDGAKHLLDLCEDEVLGLIDEALLTHAWNIGLGGERREVRVLRAAVDAYIAWDQGRKDSRHARPSTHSLSDAAACKLLLPPGHAKPFLTNGQVQRSLNCVSDHVLHLVAAKELALQPDTEYRRGPNGTALITVSSFESFLKSRRL